MKETDNNNSIDKLFNFITDNHLKSFFMHSNNVFYIHDCDHQIQFISPQIEELLGYNAIEAMVEWTEMATNAPINEKGLEFTNAAINTGIKQAMYELELRHKDGSIRWVEVNESPIVVEGKTKAIVGSLTNITHNRLAEKKLQQQYQEYLSIYQNIPEVMYVSDPHTYEMIFVNKHSQKLFGDNPIGKKCYKVLQNLDSPCDFCTNEIILNNNGEIYEWEHYNKLLGRHFLIRDQIIPWKDGREVRFELALDINTRKESEQALKESEKRYKKLINNIPEAILIQQDDSIVFTNDSGFSLLGTDKAEELIGSSLSDYLKEEIAKKIGSLLNKLSDGIESEIPVEAELIRFDKSRVEVSIYPTPIEYMGKPAIQILIKDISEQKANERRRAKSVTEREQNLRYFESIDRISNIINKGIFNDGFIEPLILELSKLFNADRSWIIEQVCDNNLAVKILGNIDRLETTSALKEIKKSEMDWQSLNLFQKTCESGDTCNQQFDNQNEYIFLSEKLNINSYLSVKIPCKLGNPKLLELHQCNGKRIWTESEQHLLRDIAGRIGQALDNVELYRDLQEKEKQLREYSDDLGKKVNERTSELENQAKKLNESQMALTFLLEDVNESRDELTDLINNMETVNKELESFSYSVSHDLRAPLTRLQGFSSALISKLGNNLDKEARHYLERIMASSHHMAELIKDMLTLSRITRKDLQIQKINVSKICNSILSELKETEPARKTKISINEKLFIEGDQSQFEILLRNILHNSWKYSFSKKITKIEVGETTHNKKKAIFIKDNGIGFNMKYYDQLFTPFRRLHTHQEIEGSGVGLATVLRIINRHKGKIWAESEENTGTIFYFSI
jgi:PAS domain S-box-containing protein